MKVDCLLALSVIHDIEQISRTDGEHTPNVDLCISILSDLMLLAAGGMLVVEMPPEIKYYAADGAYWAEVYAEHGSPKGVLMAAAKEAFGKVGNFSIDELYADKEYDGRKTFAVRGIEAETGFFGQFSALMSKPGDIQAMEGKSKYPKHWLSREADFKKSGWRYVELAEDSEEFRSLENIAATQATLYAAFRLENKNVWERYADEREAIEKNGPPKSATPKRVMKSMKKKNPEETLSSRGNINHLNMLPHAASTALTKHMKLSEKAGEILLGHGNKTNALASIGTNGLAVDFCGDAQIYLANNFGINRGSYTRQDYCGSVLNDEDVCNNIIAAPSASEPRRKRKRGNDGSSSAATKYDTQKLSGVQCRYVFLCRVLVDHATSNSNHVLTFSNDAHVYPEYLMVTN